MRYEFSATQRHDAATFQTNLRERFKRVHGNKIPDPDVPSFFLFGGGAFETDKNAVITSREIAWFFTPFINKLSQTAKSAGKTLHLL